MNDYHIKVLQSSALFHLSLGSKELFHSNFLAWIAKEYPQEVGLLFGQFLLDSSGDISIDTSRSNGGATREVKKIDLHLYFKNGQQLIIENKVRSLVYEEQLEECACKNPETKNFLLLTLLEPPLGHTGVLPLKSATWHVMTYATLAERLSPLAKAVTDSYHAGILQDYISFITNLDALFAESLAADDTPFTSGREKRMLEDLKKIRMADVYLKLKYQQIAVKVYKALKHVFPKHAVIFNTKEPQTVGAIHVNHGMYNTQGMMEVYVIVEDGLYICIQMQGSDYCHMVQGYKRGDGIVSRTYAERLKECGEWFTFDHIAHNTVYPKDKEKMFNNYGKVDFYQYVKLSDTHTIKQIAGFFVDDIRRALQRVPEPTPSQGT